MNKVKLALISRLSFGVNGKADRDDSIHGFVETLAGAYEKARNALEYRAENLVRRAAIERILKRLMLLDKNADTVSKNLLTELKWARYISKNQITADKRSVLSQVLIKYIQYSSGIITPDWIIKIASAEIEELFNLNKDYGQFTFFAFQIIKQKIKVEDPNLDLLIYYAVDKIYAASDPEQIAYHIISLAGKNIDTAKMEEGWELFNLAGRNKLLPRINKFVRRQMPPLVLLRDIYFYSPSDFKEVLSNKEKFLTRAEEVLNIQLTQMSGKISTAGVRSIVYVFLTKMILAFGVETPLEMFIYKRLALIPLILNIVFPPLLMWLTTMSMKVPSEKEREMLVQRTWYILENFDSLKNEDDILAEESAKKTADIAYWIFSFIYAVFFIGTFAVIFYTLGLIGFTLFSKMIFIFLLTIIAFFAYRISQIAKVYSWKDQNRESSSITDMVSLPILTIGSMLSQGLSRLNFLGFVFDFILEAPFKLILGFVDDWVQFLSVKKESQILD